MNNVVGNLKITEEMIKTAQKSSSKVKRAIFKGSLVAITTGVLALGVVGCSNVSDNNLNNSNTGITSNSGKMLEDYVIDTSVSDLRDLNVVLVNDGIAKEQIEQAEDSLESLGLDVDVRDINDLNKDGTECFISLTNYNGSGYKVIANYDNDNNYSDLLAIGMMRSFNASLQKGVHNMDSAKRELIPSDIEKLADSTTTPSVTIAVPNDAELNRESSDIYTSFSDKLLNGLARYKDALEHVDVNKGKFLLRPDPFENSDEYEQSLDEEIFSLNGTDTIVADYVLLNKGLPESLGKNVVVNWFNRELVIPIK